MIQEARQSGSIPSRLHQKVKRSRGDYSPMNRYLLITMIALILLFVAGSVSAHPPRDVNLTYNQTTGNLSAAFIHEVSLPETHYIMNVKVFLNGNETINQEYSTQPTADLFVYEYPLNATSGDLIEVSGQCNIGGMLQRSITVE